MIRGLDFLIEPKLRNIIDIYRIWTVGFYHLLKNDITFSMVNCIKKNAIPTINRISPFNRNDIPVTIKSEIYFLI